MLNPTRLVPALLMGLALLINPQALAQAEAPPTVLESLLSRLDRSPYPSGRQRMAKPLPYRVLGDDQAEPEYASDPPPLGGKVPWNQVDRHIGHTFTVTGKIVRTNNIGHMAFLNYSNNWRETLSIVIRDELFGSWPQSPEVYFKDKNVEITGKVTWYRNAPSLTITDPKQIRIVRDSTRRAPLGD